MERRAGVGVAAGGEEEHGEETHGRSHTRGGADAQSDKALSQARIESLRAELQRRKIDLSRVTFIAAGREDYHTAVWSEIMRTMQSGIELVLPR